MKRGSADSYRMFRLTFSCGWMNKPLCIEVLAIDYNAAVADVLAAYEGIGPNPLTWSAL